MHPLAGDSVLLGNAGERPPAGPELGHRPRPPDGELAHLLRQVGGNPLAVGRLSRHRVRFLVGGERTRARFIVNAESTPAGLPVNSEFTVNDELDPTDIGVRIRTLRKQAGLTQNDVSEVVGGHHSKVSEWELGSRVPETDALFRMAALFGVSVDYLLTGAHRAPAFVAERLRDLLAALEGDDPLGGHENAPHLEPVEGEELLDEPEEKPARVARGRAGAGRRRSR